MKMKFEKGRDGQPIARLDSGKIVLVDRYATTRPLPGEVWECEIVEKDRFAVARPVRKIEWEKEWYPSRGVVVFKNLSTGEWTEKTPSCPQDLEGIPLCPEGEGNLDYNWAVYLAQYVVTPRDPILFYKDWVIIWGYPRPMTQKEAEENEIYLNRNTNFSEFVDVVEKIRKLRKETKTKWKGKYCPSCFKSVRLERIEVEVADDEWHIPTSKRITETHYYGKCEHCGSEIKLYSEKEETRTVGCREILYKTEIADVTVKPKATVTRTFNEGIVTVTVKIEPVVVCVKMKKELKTYVANLFVQFSNNIHEVFTR